MLPEVIDLTASISLLSAAERKRKSRILSHLSATRSTDVVSLIEDNEDVQIVSRGKRQRVRPQRVHNFVDSVSLIDEVPSRTAIVHALPSCQICYDDISGGLIAGITCSHIFCTSCIANYINKAESKAALVSEKHGNVRCPGCPPSEEKGGISWFDLEAIMETNNLDLLRYAAVQRAGLDTYQCMTKGCRQRFDIKPSNKGQFVVQCPTCGVHQCPRCQKTAQEHDEKSCHELDLKKSDPESLKLMQSIGVTKCPKCGVGADKLSGCNFVMCLQCRTPYCYLCNAALEHKDHSAHFGQVGTPCYGHLFSHWETWAASSTNRHGLLAA